MRHVAAAVIGNSRSPLSKHWRVYVVSASVALGAWLSAPTPAYALPSGSEVVHGEAHIGQSGSDMTIDQTTDKAIINWDEFGIGTNESVTFHQPTAGSVALNRVLGDNPSEIYGRLTANGHIFLLNAQGVLFGKGAEVRTGGFVASSLALSDADFLAGDYTFTATADNGSVVNEGEIDVAPGGMVALIGPQVQNTGDINAPEGAVALGAGGRVTLRPAGELPLAFEVDEAALGALVQNDGELRANGGLVVLSARAKGEVLDTAVSSSGIIEARSLEARDGTIRLVGGDSGVVEVSGTLNAGGGTIDVWGDQVVLSDGAALSGETSIYYNPVSYDDADTKSDSTGNPYERYSRSGHLTAYMRVNDADDISSMRNNLDGIYALSGNIDASSLTIGTPIGGEDDPFTGILDGNSYEIDGLTVDVYGGPTGLFGSLAGTVRHLTLTNVDVTGLVNTGALAGIVEQGGTVYDVHSDGTVSAPGSVAGGLVGQNFGEMRNVSSDATVSAHNYAGGLVGENNGTIEDAHSSGSVSGTSFDADFMGGLVGWNYGDIDGASSEADVTGRNQLGGLVGWNDGDISESHSSGIVTGEIDVGGLVGRNDGNIRDAHSTGDVDGTEHVGGLVGLNNVIDLGEDGTAPATIRNSYSAGTVTGDTHVGGLVGWSRGLIESAYNNGTVTGAEFYVGGLVGQNDGNISDSYNAGKVTGDTHVGGLVGGNTYGGWIDRSFNTGQVNGGVERVGGVVGDNGGNVTYAYNTGTVIGTGDMVGGLVGANTLFGSVGRAYSTGSVTGADNVGGLVGTNNGGILEAYSTGAVNGNSYVGGLVGHNNVIHVLGGGTIEAAYSTGDVSGSGDIVGGLVGGNDGGTIHQVYSTGRVSGADRVGGLVGHNDSEDGSISSAYWDTTTSGMTDSAGGVGKKTEELRAGLPTDFDTDRWAIIDGKTYAYLTWGSDREPRVISGTVYDERGRAASGIDVWALRDGALLTSAFGDVTTSTSKDGSYYMVLNPTLSGPGDDVFLYVGDGDDKAGNVFYDGWTGRIDNADIYAGRFTMFSNEERFSDTIGRVETTLGNRVGDSFLFTMDRGKLSLDDGVTLQIHTSGTFDLDRTLRLANGRLVYRFANRDYALEFAPGALEIWTDQLKLTGEPPDSYRAAVVNAWRVGLGDVTRPGRENEDVDDASPIDALPYGDDGSGRVEAR